MTRLTHSARARSQGHKARLALALRAARMARPGCPSSGGSGSGVTLGEDAGALAARLESAVGIASQLAEHNRALMRQAAVSEAAPGAVGGAPAAAAAGKVRVPRSSGSLQGQRSPSPEDRRGGGGGGGGNEDAASPSAAAAEAQSLRIALRESREDVLELRRQLAEERAAAEAAGGGTAVHEEGASAEASALARAHAQSARLRDELSSAQARCGGAERSLEAERASLAAFKANHAAVLRQLEATHARLAAERAATARLGREEARCQAEGARCGELEALLAQSRREAAELAAENQAHLGAALAAPSRAAELRAARAALAESARGRAVAEGSLADARRLLLLYGCSAEAAVQGAPPQPGEDYRSVRAEREALRAAAARLRVELAASQEALDLLRTSPPSPSPPPPPPQQQQHAGASMPPLLPVGGREWAEAEEERGRLSLLAGTQAAQLAAREKEAGLLLAQLGELREELALARAAAAGADAEAQLARAQADEADAAAALTREEAAQERERAQADAHQAAAAAAAATAALTEALPPATPEPADAAAGVDEDYGLGPGENILELTVHELTLERTALRGEQQPTTFLTVDFFEHETQATPLVAGFAASVAQTYEFVVLVDSMFIQFMELDCLRVDLNVAHGLDFRTLGALAFPLRRILDAAPARAGEHHLEQFRAPNGDVIGTLTLSMRLLKPISDALRLYRSLPPFEWMAPAAGGTATADATRQGRTSFEFVPSAPAPARPLPPPPSPPPPPPAAASGTREFAEDEGGPPAELLDDTTSVTVALSHVQLRQPAVWASRTAFWLVFDFLSEVFAEEDQRTDRVAMLPDGLLPFTFEQSYPVGAGSYPAAAAALRSAMAEGGSASALQVVLVADGGAVGFTKFTFDDLRRGDGDGRDAELELHDAQGEALGTLHLRVHAAEALAAAL